jgi:hypothetical protein
MNADDHDLWDFKNDNTEEFTHGLHLYPARMVPGIARELINRYSNEGDLIYDPFCGSGTTLVEGIIAKRKTVGIDLNPFAVLLSKVKTTPIYPDYLEMEWNFLKNRLVSFHAAERMKEFDKNAGTFLDLRFWYKSFVLRDLFFIRATINDLFSDDKDPVKSFMNVILAKTAREVSNQRQREFKRWRMPESELSNFKPVPIKVFIENCEVGLESMRKFYYVTEGKSSSKVYRKDARTFNIHNKSSLVVSSPPYGDSGTTVAYGQFSSFALEWLGLNEISPIQLDSEKLGSMGENYEGLQISKHLSQAYKHVQRFDVNRGKYMLQFFGGMTESLHNIKDSMKEDGILSLVLGNRRIKGVDIPTDAIISELAQDVGFELIETHKRKIMKKRMPYTTMHWEKEGIGSPQRTMNSETILVFKIN